VPTSISCGQQSYSLRAYCPNTKFGKLILRKISKIFATRWYILQPNCTKFEFGWGFAPDPAGELTTLPQTH